MDSPNHPDYNEDSNSNFSVSNIAPLVKRDTKQKVQQVASDPEEKIEELGYQIVEQLTVITPLEVHPNKLCSSVENYYYQRKLPSMIEQELRKRQQKEKIDFIMAITSLFKKSFAQTQYKFAILIPMGGLVYFFFQELQHLPKLLVAATHNFDFTYNLEKDGIKFRELRKREYQKERILVEGQYIKLFFGYFLNWVLSKNINIEIYSNFVFDLAFRETPMVMKLNENRHQYNHLYYKEEGYLGQKESKLYLIKFQSLWFKEDIRKIEEKLKEEERKRCKQAKVQKIQHQYQFKINSFTAGLSEAQVEKSQPKGETQ